MNQIRAIGCRRETPKGIPVLSDFNLGQRHIIDDGLERCEVNARVHQTHVVYACELELNGGNQTNPQEVHYRHHPFVSGAPGASIAGVGIPHPPTIPGSNNSNSGILKRKVPGSQL